MRLLGLFLTLATTTAFAGEYCVLASGARMHIERHEADGAKVRLYYVSGFVEMNLEAVRGFEEDDPAPPPARLAADSVAVDPGAPETAVEATATAPKLS